jgi:AcrR family transcriptional regulator
MANKIANSARDGAWQWSTSPQTQQALLGAAREIFAERGFSGAGINDVVERAQSSIGSLYHHFGGKSELFVALWQNYQRAHEEATRQAVIEAKRAGVSDPMDLFVAGARASLQCSWQLRDLTLIFFSGDAPPDFGAMRRSTILEWMAQNDALLGLTDAPMDRLYVSILMSLIGEGAHEVAAARTRRQADAVIEAVVEYLRRLMVSARWEPPAEHG